MRRKKALLPLAATALVGMVLGTGSPAFGSEPLPQVVSQIPAAYTPHIATDGTGSLPLALAVGQSEDGTTMYVGGRFQVAENADRSTTYPRDNIMAFDADTGALTDFAPDLNAPVYAILGVDDSVYVGGEFSTVNGVARPALVKLDASTGAMDTTFNPVAIPGGRVSEIRLVNDRLIVGGTFRAKLLALNPITGKNTGYIGLPIVGKLPLTNSKPEVYRFAVNPDGTRLVGVGNFLTVDGQDRKRAFMLDLGADKATLSPWYYAPLDKKCLSNTPTRQAYLDDVDFSPDGSYFVFASTGFVQPEWPAQTFTAICDAAARFETNILEPRLPTWINYTGGDTLHSVAVTGAAVYVQGHNRWLDNPYGKDSLGEGGLVRKGIGALDSQTGEALDWNPVKPAAQGGQDFLATETGLWVASDSLRFGGKYHRGIAFAPLP